MDKRDKVPENPGEEIPGWLPSAWIIIPLFLMIIGALFMLAIN